ncbi:hypothetical protein [Streptomyces sp900116325]|uniref:hypothetical protein n=1 Tax=Streptomyces sp. 900116325 TaxID=3154295 RepID=UPI00331F0BDF
MTNLITRVRDAILATLPGATADTTVVTIEYAWSRVGYSARDAWSGTADGLADRIAAAVAADLEEDTREDESTPELSYQAQQLLAHIRDLPSFRWTTGKAAQVYADLGYPKRGRRHNARSHLHELAARDLLTVHGPHDGRYFLLAQKDGA